MKTKQALQLIGIALLAAAAGWFIGRHRPAHSAAPGSETHGTAKSSSGGGRKLLYYQSAMHPWIKSDKPGRCTICGMELTPVFEGDKPFDVGEGMVTLGSNSIQVIGVQAVEVRRQPLRRHFRFAGVLEDNDAKHRVVSAYIDGRIDELAVNYVGAEVVAGQPLATFYSPTLLTAEREYVALLRANKGKAGNDEQQNRLLAAAGQRLKRLGLTDAQVAALPDKSETNSHSQLLASTSGTVVARNVYAGQYVKEGDKLFELADFSTMWLVFDAYESDLAWLKHGQKVEVTTPALPGLTFTGAVAFIDPNLKETTRSAKVRVELPNPLQEQDGHHRRTLYHKLYADALLQVDVPAVLAVPRTAVISPGTQPIAYLDRGNGVYEQRHVKLGRVGDELWEVLEGLAEGERVVTTGNLLLDAQAQLNQNPSEPPAASSSNRVDLADTRFTAEETQAIQAFLTSGAVVGDALASDNLPAFNREAAAVHAHMPAFLKAFDAHAPWQPMVERIEATGHLEQAADLAQARKRFHPFSTALTTFALALRRYPAFSSLKLYECPMLNKAVPGAPRLGQWLQSTGPLRNPFFGAEMLDCGSEVK